MTKKLLSILLSVCMVLTMLPTVAFAAGTTTADFGDFSVTYDDGGTAPTFNSGVLTFTAAGTYTVSMSSGKTSTSHTIVVSASGVTLNLDGVNIAAPQGAMYTAGGNALTVTSDAVTLNVIANSSLTGGAGGPGGMEITPAGNGGAGISGNVTVTGEATLTVTGGGSGQALMGPAGIAGVGIKGNVNVSGAATLIAISGSGMASIAICDASRSGGGTITVGDGYTVVAGADAASAVAFPKASTYVTSAQYVAITPPASQTRWGVAGSGGAAPTTWVNSGTLDAAMTYANANSGAYIQLQSDVDTTATLMFSGGTTTILDLNGKTIDANDGAFSVLTVNGNLTLCDSSAVMTAAQGKITGGNQPDQGGGVYIESTGSFTMTGGNITGNTSGKSGGGVFGNGSGNVMTMTGGSITGNHTKYNGGGIFIQTGDFIVGGTANITGNTSGTAPDILTNNVYLYGTSFPPAQQILTISTATPLSTGAFIGVRTTFVPSALSPLDFTGANSADYSGYFTSDNSSYVVQNSGSGNVVQLAVPVTSAPTVTAVSPANGGTAGGTSVTITGTNLSGATAVKFGSTSATSFTVNSSTSITATAPAGAGTVNITVTTAGGTSATSTADQFTYALPTAAQYAAADPAAASGTDYVLDTDNETLTIKTDKGAAWWSAYSSDYLDYSIKLANDITVSAFQWTPVGNMGSSPTYFTGCFDGQGHSIKGLSVDVASGTDDAFAGLFGCVENASIKNIGLIDAQVSASSSSDAFVGGIVGLGFTGTSIINSYCTGNVSASSSSTDPMRFVNAGGIAGKIIPGTNGSIKNCYSAASVEAEVTGSAAAYMGGITGFTTGGSIVDSYYLAGSVPSDKAFNTYSSPTVIGCGTFEPSGALTAGTADQFKSGQTLVYGNALLAALNSWVAATVSTDYYTWAADNGTTPTNDGYPVFGTAWAELQAQWGVAGAENAAPNTWVGSGSLTNAVEYANELASGTAYIQLLFDVDTTAALEFENGKTTVLDFNGKTIDGSSIPAGSGANRSVLTVNGNLTLCDSSTVTVADQGKITGGHGSGDSMGGGVYVEYSGIFIMTGGNITGNTAVNGGGVGNYGTFNMTGGSIAGNSCIFGSASPSCGGGVVNLGYFNMSGGSITGNTAAVGGAGGGVLDIGGGMTLSGNVNISGNTVGTASDNIALLGAGSGGAGVNIAGALTNTTAIGVSIVDLSRDNVFTPKAAVFTFGDAVTNSDYISKFVSDNSGFAVIADGSQLKLAAAQAITKADTTNGSFTVKVNGNVVPSAKEGQTVTVTPTANSGYELDTITVCKTGDSSTTVTVTSSNTFIMPAYGVTVNVVFKVSSVPAYTISGTIKGSDTSAGIPASLQLKNSSGNVGGAVTAAADGSYSITGVSAGSYTIAVSCTGYDSGTFTGVTVSNANITGKNLTLTKSISGLTDAQKLAAAQAAIVAAINRLSFSNSTTAADILSVAQAASLYGVTVTWDSADGFTKTEATTAAAGSIRGTLKLELNHESGGIGINATIAKLSIGGDNGGGGSTTPPTTKPTEPVTGNSEIEATVDDKGNTSISLTDKTITDAIADAKAVAAKKGVNAGDITAIIHVTAGGQNANTVTVNLPKTTQEQVIDNKIANVQLVIDRPDLTIGINLAAVTELNRQAKADVQLSATRIDNAKLYGDAKAAIGNRPVYDFKATYGSGKFVTDFGKGSVSVEIPYTLQKGETSDNVCAAYVDTEGKVTYLTDSSYDVKRGMVVFFTSHFSTYGVAYKTSFNFTDIDGHWAKDDILFVAKTGIMTGTSSTTFSPNSPVTRGMFVTALGRLANADISTYTKSSFIDVKPDAYYMGYIEWGVKNNILVGIGGGKFNPDGLVTREQMAAILDRYATAIGFKLPEVRAQKIFADNTKIGAWAAPSVERIQMAGIIQGKSNNLFDPKGTATRAEVSAVLRRFK